MSPPPEEPTVWDLAGAAARHLLDELGPHDAALVVGSGWASALDTLGEPRGEVAMADLPGCAVPTVAGHAGSVRSVEIGGVRVLALCGRSHLYEGHDAGTVVHGVRAAVLTGCGRVVLTNAAGSIRPDWPVGTPVLVADHLNLTGHNPLVGPEPPTGGRFADMGDLYRSRLRAAARAERADLAEGVYAALVGPSFETPAEIRALRTLGADLVGMSTALEAIAAHHLGAEVAAVSLVTNPAAGLTDHIDHEAVLAAGAGAAGDLAEVLVTLLSAP
ncbi:MAG: purine-nucleoside phosphorylase [Microthrixaceae bacterium]